MATQIIQGAKVYFDGLYISTDINALAIKMMADTPECTTLADTWKKRKPGLMDFDLSMEGYVDCADGGIDDKLYAQFGVVDVPVLAGITDGSAGSPCYFFTALEAGYTPGGKIGDMFAFSAEAKCAASAAVRGKIIHNAARTSSGNGAGVNVGAQPANTRIQAQLQVYSLTASGGSPSLAVTVQAASDNTFADAVTVATFTAAAATAAEHVVADNYDLPMWTNDANDMWNADTSTLMWATGLGASHTWYRAVYALTDITSTDFAVSIGFK